MSRISSLLTAALCAAAVVQAGLAPCPGAEPTSAEKKIEEEAGTEACMSTKVYPVDDLIARHVPGSAEEDQDESADFDSMIEMITSTVDPATWVATDEITSQRINGSPSQPVNKPAESSDQE